VRRMDLIGEMKVVQRRTAERASDILCAGGRILLLCSVFLALGAGTVGAQQGGGTGAGLRNGTAGSFSEIIDGPANLLDAPVSRTEYVLGPGDGVALSIFGEMNALHQLAVTPEGTVVIPAVGVVDVLGLNLDEAQARVREQVLRFYRNIGIHLTLARIRQFRVYVVGDVVTPGAQVVSATTRVSEVVPAVLDTARVVMPRNVVLRRASGESLVVDLVRFQQTGDFHANPTMRDGDALIVPAVDRTVQIHGRVGFPGLYEHRPNETLAELLAIANGGSSFPSDASDTIRVSRAVERNRQEVHLFSRSDALGPRGAAFVLHPFDALYVPAVSEFGQQRTATITGQVHFPGTYPIHPEVTTVRELVEMAGGFTPDASLVTATLRRRGKDAPADRMQQLRSVPPELLSSRERRVLQAASQGGDAQVAVDFQQLFIAGDDAFNHLIQDRDSLSVPRRQQEVAILGAVLRPGLVQHVPGQDVRQLIQLAGGYGRNADRGGTVVVKAGSGVRVDAEDVRSLDPGDAIVVPYRERFDYLRALQTTSTVVTTITGLVLTFLAFVR
jgi:polysaccharide biosynthesis/export protein